MGQKVRVPGTQSDRIERRRTGPSQSFFYFLQSPLTALEKIKKRATIPSMKIRPSSQLSLKGRKKPRTPRHHPWFTPGGGVAYHHPHTRAHVNNHKSKTCFLICMLFEVCVPCGHFRGSFGYILLSPAVCGMCLSVSKDIHLMQD